MDNSILICEIFLHLATMLILLVECLEFWAHPIASENITTSFYIQIVTVTWKLNFLKTNKLWMEICVTTGWYTYTFLWHIFGGKWQLCHNIFIIFTVGNFWVTYAHIWSLQYSLEFAVNTLGGMSINLSWRPRFYLLNEWRLANMYQSSVMLLRFQQFKWQIAT